MPILCFYSSSGRLLNQINWDKGRVVSLGWAKETLICVLEYGSVRLYQINGEYTQFSLGQTAKDFGIIEACFWESGLVVLTGNLKFIVVNNINEPRPKELADPGLTELPHCWTIIPPDLSSGRHLEVLVAVKSTILVIDIGNVNDKLITEGPFKKLSVSPDGNFLALFNSDGKLLVLSTDFQQSIAEFASKSSVAPIQLSWCGNDSVLIYWMDNLVMVGPQGDWLKFPYEESIFLAPEDDGVRIFGTDTYEFLQRVPTSNESVFKFGSTSPGAILNDAFDHFEKKSPKADENIRSIKTQLTEAVDTCISAAGNESNIKFQKSLLRAASFGKCFLDYYKSEKFVDMCNIIRVLNAVREDSVGIPLTYAQFIQLGAENLINRLVNRKLHLLALRICEHLKISKNNTLIHWACAKIKNSTIEESAMSKVIIDTLGGNKSGISYAKVAQAAYQSGQSKLAARLLDFEPRSADQVPLLLSMDEDEGALIKAVESGDTDLVYLVMLHMKRKLPVSDFFRLLSGKPLAVDLFVCYCKQSDLKLLNDFYYQEDLRGDQAKSIVIENMNIVDISEKVGNLKMAYKLFHEDKEFVFEAKVTDDQLRLIQVQQQLERDTGFSFAGLSLSESISKCLQLGHGNRALKIQKDFKVPDKRFWWLKVRTLVDTNNWDGLDKFVKSTPKFAISGVIETLIKFSHFNQASKYVEIMVKESKDKESQAAAQKYVEILQAFSTASSSGLIR